MANRTTLRTALGKRTRFEILKRDGFACRYCGRKPPEVLLHVDHIKPVAEGGTNEALNLVTACRDCNLGKSAKSLDEVPPPLDVTAMRQEMERQRDQVLAYYSAEDQVRGATAVDRVGRVWRDEFNTSYSPDEDITRWLRDCPEDWILEAIEIGAAKFPEFYNNVTFDRRNYVNGILRCKSAQSEGNTCGTCCWLSDDVCLRRSSEEYGTHFTKASYVCGRWEAL